MDQNIEQVEIPSLLEQVLLRPSGKIIPERFAAKSETLAPCHAGCTGECHSSL